MGYQMLKVWTPKILIKTRKNLFQYQFSLLKNDKKGKGQASLLNISTTLFNNSIHILKW